MIISEVPKSNRSFSKEKLEVQEHWGFLLVLGEVCLEQLTEVEILEKILVSNSLFLLSHQIISIDFISNTYIHT